MALKKTLKFIKEIEQHGALTIFETLAPMLTDERMQKIDEVLDQRLSSLTVAVESPHDIYNALAIIRTAEAFGVQYVHIIDWQGERRKSVRTTMGTHRWTDLHYHKSLAAFKDHTPAYKIAGACVDGGMSIEQIPLDAPLVLLFGNEKDGLTKEALELCDYRFHIPMFGMVDSLNLSVAAAITLQKICERKRAAINAPGELGEAQKALERAWYAYRCIGTEKAQAILKLQIGNVE